MPKPLPAMPFSGLIADLCRDLEIAPARAPEPSPAQGAFFGMVAAMMAEREAEGLQRAA